MQNALLIGLSRQVTLERRMDVIANNVANANTNGFKADHSLFEEYLNSNAREDNFVASDRRVSYVQDRGTFRDVGQGPMEPTKNPLDIAISATPISRFRPMAPSATPATANSRSTAPASSSPPTATSC